MIVKIQIRRGLSTEWSSVNPILSSGEFGYETDTGKKKIGNGTLAWNDLGYDEIEGPQGEQGPIGPQGPEGPQGPPTTDASLLTSGTLSPERIANTSISEAKLDLGVTTKLNNNVKTTQVDLTGAQTGDLLERNSSGVYVPANGRRLVKRLQVFDESAVFYDSFARANGAAGISDSGSTYTGNIYGISNNRLVGSAITTTPPAMLFSLSFSNHKNAEFEYGFVGNGTIAFNNFRYFLAFKDVNNCIFFASLNGILYNIIKIEAGVSTTLSQIVLQPNLGVPNNLKFKTKISLYKSSTIIYINHSTDRALSNASISFSIDSFIQDLINTGSFNNSGVGLSGTTYCDYIKEFRV